MWWKRDTGLFVICERIEELNTVILVVIIMCMQKYYYGDQLREGRKLYCTYCKLCLLRKVHQ